MTTPSAEFEGSSDQSIPWNDMQSVVLNVYRLNPHSAPHQDITNVKAITRGVRCASRSIRCASRCVSRARRLRVGELSPHAMTTKALTDRITVDGQPVTSQEFSDLSRRGESYTMKEFSHPTAPFLFGAIPTPQFLRTPLAEHYAPDQR